AAKGKVPYQAAHPSRNAKIDDPSTWGDYGTSAAVVSAGNADGVGFVLSDSEYCAFDVDNCRDPGTGEVHPWAQGLINRAGSYVEVTPSKAGLRIIGTGDGAAVHRKLDVGDGVSVEVYRKATRYITVTGDALAGSPSTIANVDALIDEVLVE